MGREVAVDNDKFLGASLGPGGEVWESLVTEDSNFR